MKKKTVGVLVCLVVGLSSLMVVSAEPVLMSPHKIVLNAQGNADDVQAVVSMSLEPGYQVTDFQVKLWFDDVEVAEAETFRYCPVDDNFLTGFDRTTLLNNPDVIAMAGQTVVATVEGWFTAESIDGDFYTRYFSGTDVVEIVKPGRK